MSMQGENTPHIVHTRSLIIEEPNTAMLDCKSKLFDVKNTSTFNVSEETKDWLKKPILIQHQKKSTCKKYSKSKEIKTLDADHSNTDLTNMHLSSIADRVKLRKTRNSLDAASKITEASHKKLRSIKIENICTPSIVHTKIKRSSKSKPQKKSTKKIHAPNQVKVRKAKNTKTAVPSKPDDLLKIPFSIKNENSSLPQIFYTSISEENRLNKNSPLLTSISTISILKHKEDGQVRNYCTKVSMNNCIHKNGNSTIKTANVQHGLNGNQIITKPKELSVESISKNSISHNNGV